MKVKFKVEMSIKDIPKEVVILGTETTKDCVKIIISEAMKNHKYECHIDDISIESVETEGENG